MLQILGIPVYKCNRLRLLSQNSFEDDDLPVQVKEKRMCSHGFRQELRAFQPSTFQDMFLDTCKLVGKNVLLNCPTIWLSETIYYFDGKKVTQLAMPFVFINCSTIPVVLEMHINSSCCLRCLMKLTGICNKINFKFDSY